MHTLPGFALVEDQRDAGAVVFTHEVSGGEFAGLDQRHAITLIRAAAYAYHAAHG